jgi:hypothetical protein
MAHEITENDAQEGTEMAWHGLTRVKEVIQLATCWLATWDVKFAKLFRMVGGQAVESEAAQIVCTDNDAIAIGKPVDPNTYGLVTNKDFLRVVGEAMGEIPGAEVVSVGSYKNRSRVSVTVRLPQLEAFKAAGREFKPFLNFLSSHDKSAPFFVNTSNICTVCNNTFQMNLADSEGKIVSARIKHSKNVQDRLDNIAEIVTGFLHTQREFQMQLGALHGIKISEADAKAWFAGFLTEENDTDKAISTRRLNMVERLTELFRAGAGNRGEDLSDVFQAVTDYYSHESAGGDDNRKKQFASSEFGDGAKSKKLAFVQLGDANTLKLQIERGRKILANPREEKTA